MAGAAESAISSAAGSVLDQGVGMATDAAQSAVSSAASAVTGGGGDEDGLVDRVVEAVMSRIQQEGDTARERSGAFNPHFGG